MGDYRSQLGDEPLSSSVAVKRKPRVLVTGFGPFGEHAINASWEAVQQLKAFGDLTDTIDLVTEEIPVVYAQVSTLVPSLWQKHRPDLVIHCGVSALIAWKNIIQIERNAHSFGYHRLDVCSTSPSDGFCNTQHGQQCLKTSIDLESLVGKETGRREDCVLSCQISEDAGRYLCEFIYYTSLSINADKSLFIHVPPLYKPFSAKEIARAIKGVILKVVMEGGKNAEGTSSVSGCLTVNVKS